MTSVSPRSRAGAEEPAGPAPVPAGGAGHAGATAANRATGAAPGDPATRSRVGEPVAVPAITPEGPVTASRGPDRPEGRRGREGPDAGRVRPGRALAVSGVLLLVALAAGVSIGPAGIPLGAVADSLIAHLPWHPSVPAPAIDVAIVWQIRLPRVLLGALVGAMLAGGGAAYQGVFRNPLADPYLLGVAAGAGLGATTVIITGANPALLPVAAFAGAVVAVALTYFLGASTGRRGTDPGAAVGGSGTASILLAGIAVAALLTAAQTYLQQSHSQSLQAIYSWILGGLSTADWGQVRLISPYVLVAGVALLAHRRLLDVLAVGEVEAGTLGVNVARVRMSIVIAATLGTAAAVAVSGLIGFVGIIVPHAIRLSAGPSYRIVLPVSMIGGAAFLVLTDIAARTVQAPAEVPIGVLTAAIGAPFFLFVLRSRRARQGLS